jgi:dihydroxyacetone kinase-like protein
MTLSKNNLLEWIKAYAAEISANKTMLTQLDAAIGDADHGANMDRGFQAVLARLPAMESQDIGGLLRTVAMTLISTVGGASGPLYGTFFLQMSALTAGKAELTLDEFSAAFSAGLEGIAKRGKAVPGDKTMLDCLQPASEALRAAAAEGAGLAEALRRAELAAREGMLATIPLTARKGRASYLGERSAGHQDPGATSAHLLVQAALQAWEKA